MSPPAQPSTAPLLDHLGRPLSDLRISVTDRCNFRCTFCMPAENRYHFVPRPEILSFEEIVRLARIFVGLGVRKIRLTGGEPLLRSEIEHLVAELAAIEGLEDLALTTNGFLLAAKARALKDAGLDRVTVSFHSLDPAVFERINGVGLALDRVLEGLEEARRVGLSPIKLNIVPIRGINEHEIVDLARWARDHGYTARFIEYMDVGTLNRWRPEEVLSAREIVERISAEMPLEPVERAHPGEVAARWRYVGGGAEVKPEPGGEVGVIPSITEPFCGDCSRVRLSAEGKVFTCLFSAVGHDLKAPLRSGEDDEELAARLRELWRARTDRYSEERTEALRAGRFSAADKVEMFRIGG
ncbi:MAG: GTP 3',8-cyclase MoaA [Acidobacteria bacterium]|nr:GTP 3',8-cyclase MoaA [Acidobacteriota bacterium]